MAVSKVNFGNNTLIDLTGDTVRADKLLTGYTAHDASGSQIVGTADLQVGGLTSTPSSNSTSISFSLTAEPSAFCVIATTQIQLSTTYSVLSVTSDGTNINGVYGYKGNGNSNGYAYVSSSYFSTSFSSGTFTIRTSSSSNGGYFRSGVTYALVYALKKS